MKSKIKKTRLVILMLPSQKKKIMSLAKAQGKTMNNYILEKLGENL